MKKSNVAFRLGFAGRHLLVCAAVAATLVLSACASRSISSVRADPGRYRDHQITVSGVVVESFSLLNRGAYRVDDETAQLWVVTDGGSPAKGRHVSVTGTLRQAYNLGSLAEIVRLPIGESALVMVESSRHVRD